MSSTTGIHFPILQMRILRFWERNNCLGWKWNLFYLSLNIQVWASLLFPKVGTLPMPSKPRSSQEVSIPQSPLNRERCPRECGLCHLALHFPRKTVVSPGIKSNVDMVWITVLSHDNSEREGRTEGSEEERKSGRSAAKGNKQVTFWALVSLFVIWW
jgi:hypothetical protein